MARSYEQRTLHFSLSFVPDDVEIKLHVGRERHLLQRHTTASLTVARRENRALRLLPDHEATHFVPDLRLPSDQAQLLFVTTTPRRTDGRLPTLLLTKLHIPKDAVRKAWQRERANGTIPRGPHPALLAAGVADDGTDPEIPPDVHDWASALDAAVQAVFQHGELLNIGADAAATAILIIQHSKGISDLASKILQQATAHMKDPNASNWVEDVPYSQPDGTPSSKHRYVWSKLTQQWMLTPMQDSLRKVKNTPSLQSSPTNAGNYTVLSGITAVGSPQSVETLPRLGGVHLAASRPRRVGKSETVWTVNDYTPQHGFTYNGDVELKDGSFSVSFTNSWLRWLSGYVEFLGPNAQPVVPEGWTSQVPSGVAGTYDSDTKKYVTLFSAVDTILGIPLGASPTEISFRWPSNAAGVRILAGGIGRTGGIQGQDGAYYGGWDAQICAAGAIMTGIFCYGVPTVCLVAGAAIPQTALNELAKSVIGIALDVGLALINGPIATAISHGELTSALIAFADSIPHLLLEAPGLAAAISAAVAVEDAVEEATPVFGWIALGLSILSTVANLVQTSVEVGLSPAVFDVRATRAIGAEWTLQPDPGHKEWPLNATHYVVTAAFTDGTTRVATGQVGSPPQTDPITVSFNAANENELPAGGTVQFTANFYSDTDWLCGSATSKPLSAAIDADKLIVPEQAIEEHLVPLQNTTRYLYQKSATWDAEEKRHVWASARPSATHTSLNPSNIGNYIGALGQITVNQPQNQLAYSWQASGQNIPPTNQQLYAFQTISTLTSPEDGLRFVPNGFVGAAAPLYDLTGGPRGNNFYLDPSNGMNHLRQIVLDGSSGNFTLLANASWGRFNEPIKACIIHPDGYAVGVNAGNAKLEVLRLPSGSTTDAAAPFADIFGGYGTRPGLMHQPVGVAPALGSGVIVLENADASLQAPARFQGFDLMGNPAPIFEGHLPTALVRTEASPITCLAIATESKGFIYVLKYVGDGSQTVNYLLDIYAPDGSFLAQTAGLPAGGIAVDLWRTLFTLDYQQIAKPQGERTEPSVSFWIPSTPS